MSKSIKTQDKKEKWWMLGHGGLPQGQTPFK